MEQTTMRRIPIDSSKVRFISTGKAAARAQYAELADGSRRRVPDSHDTDDQGRPLWVIDCLIDGDDGDRAQIASVKVASFDVPEFRLGDEVRFSGLVAVPYMQQGSNRSPLAGRPKVSSARSASRRLRPDVRSPPISGPASGESPPTGAGPLP
jgi:hypothetical protein